MCSEINLRRDGRLAPDQGEWPDSTGPSGAVLKVGDAWDLTNADHGSGPDPGVSWKALDLPAGAPEEVIRGARDEAVRENPAGSSAKRLDLLVDAFNTPRSVHPFTRSPVHPFTSAARTRAADAAGR